MKKTPKLYLPSGKIIDQRWQIIDLIHIGGVSEIYRVSGLTMNDRGNFALKIVKDELKMKDSLRNGFQNEISVLTGLPYVAHPNAPQFMASGEWRDRIYIVMELITGIRLDSIINSGVVAKNFDSALFLGLIKSICGILQDLQWMDAIHRDIAPSNIIRHSKLNFKLIDFNFACFKYRQPQQVYYKHDQTGGTETIADFGFRGGSRRWYPNNPVDMIFGRRRFPGQLAYSAPKQIINTESIDFRSDIFSFGLVLYHLLTDYLPYQANSIEEKMAIFTKEKPLHVYDYNPTVPRKIGDRVMSMISVEESDRPMELLEIAADLMPLLWNDELGGFIL